jgi:hypothetical protein
MTDRISTKHVIDHFISTIVGKIKDFGEEDRGGLTDEEEELLDDADLLHSITHAQTPKSVEHEMLFARMKSRKKHQDNLDLFGILVKFIIFLSLVMLIAIMSYLIFTR